MKVILEFNLVSNQALQELLGILAKYEGKSDSSTTVSVTPGAPATSAKVIKVDPPKVELPKVNTGDVTLEILRSIVQDKIQKGHREAIKAALKKFEAANVSALKPENFVEFHGIITALK